MSTDKHTKLADQAFCLKKAWLLSQAILGTGQKLTATDLKIPGYKSWENKALKRQVADLEDDFNQGAKHMFLKWKRSNMPATVRWFSNRFDEWQMTGGGLFELGRVQEIETKLGLLGHRRRLECPPYGQVILQGFRGSAIRHPEYHLAQDLALLYDLFLDSESMLVQNEQLSSEHSQSLARSVIITCFNLLESTASGLAIGWLMEHPDAPAATVKKLQKHHGPVDNRLKEIVSNVAQNSAAIDFSIDPFKSLFGRIKMHRNAFVHCEPGAAKDEKIGKEERFHDVGVQLVNETVSLTLEVISLVWKAVHGTERPRWLPKRDSAGRFNKVHVTLQLSQDNVHDKYDTD